VSHLECECSPVLEFASIVLACLLERCPQSFISISISLRSIALLSIRVSWWSHISHALYTEVEIAKLLLASSLGYIEFHISSLVKAGCFTDLHLSAFHTFPEI
jgi:hypothetical protein